MLMNFAHWCLSEEGAYTFSIFMEWENRYFWRWMNQAGCFAVEIVDINY